MSQLSTPLHRIAREGLVDVYQYLTSRVVSKDNDVRHAIGLDALDGEGLTPLMLASRSSAEAMVELLVEAGADIHVNSLYGTALHWRRQVEI